MSNILGPSWRTNLAGFGGLLAAGAAGIALVTHGNYNFSGPEWSTVYAAVAAALGNFSARDNKVTSEAAGATDHTPEPPKA